MTLSILDISMIFCIFLLIDSKGSDNIFPFYFSFNKKFIELIISSTGLQLFFKAFPFLIANSIIHYNAL